MLAPTGISAFHAYAFINKLILSNSFSIASRPSIMSLRYTVPCFDIYYFYFLCARYNITIVSFFAFEHLGIIALHDDAKIMHFLRP